MTSYPFQSHIKHAYGEHFSDIKCFIRAKDQDYITELLATNMSFYHLKLTKSWGKSGQSQLSINLWRIPRLGTGSSSPGSVQFFLTLRVHSGLGNGHSLIIQREGGREVKRNCHAAEDVSAFLICITWCLEPSGGNGFPFPDSNRGRFCTKMNEAP